MATPLVEEGRGLGQNEGMQARATPQPRHGGSRTAGHEVGIVFPDFVPTGGESDGPKQCMESSHGGGLMCDEERSEEREERRRFHDWGSVTDKTNHTKGWLCIQATRCTIKPWVWACVGCAFGWFLHPSTHPRRRRQRTRGRRESKMSERMVFGVSQSWKATAIRWNRAVQQPIPPTLHRTPFLHLVCLCAAAAPAAAAFSFFLPLCPPLNQPPPCLHRTPIPLYIFAHTGTPAFVPFWL